MLQNAYFLAKFGADTAENEQHFAKNLPKTGNDPTGPEARAGPLAAPAPAPGGRRMHNAAPRGGVGVNLLKFSKF